MAFDAKVIKVFISCPNEVDDEKKVVRETIGRWNAINAEEYGIAYLPISWDINSVPEFSKPPQTYINEEILDKCDILVALFWTTLGSKTRSSESASVEEIKRHVAYGKRAMIYFSNKKIDIKAFDEKKYKELKNWKEEIRHISTYGEFTDSRQLSSLLITHLTSLARERKYRAEYDSDKLALIKDDAVLAKEILKYFPLVSYNLLKRIYDENRSDEVWQAMLDKLTKSPAELRYALIILAQNGAFRHYFFTNGYEKLAEIDQACFGGFMSDLYSINKFEFKAILDKNIFAECEFKTKLLENIRKKEEQRKNKGIIV